MADQFQITPPTIRAEGKDVPPEQIQAGFNSLARQTQLGLNSVASDPSGPASGDLGGTYPGPTVVAVHATGGTLDGVVIGGTTPAAGSFTTVSATTPVGVTSGGTGQNALNAHNVILGEGSSAVGFAAPGTAGRMLISQGAAVDPAFANNPVIAGGTIDNAPIGQTTPAAGNFTTLVSSTGVGVASGGTGRTTLTAHSVLLGEGTSSVAFAGPGATAGTALISAGASADPVFGNPTGTLINIQTITATSTYTPTTGTNSIVVEIVGGGGAGGGTAATSTGQYAVSGGGGSGGFARSRITSGFSGVTVTIGAGGTGVSGAAGNSGTASSFGALITAPGGGGGGIGTATVNTAPTTATPGAAGTLATGGTILNSAGYSGLISIGTGGVIAGGMGASSPYGSGGAVSFQTTGGAASGKGAGGGGVGASSSQAATTGGAGSAGVCIIYEFA